MASALISLAVSLLVILFLYNYLAPVGLPNSLLGPQYSSLIGSSSYGALVPGGIVGILLLTALSRIGSLASAVTSPGVRSPDEMMRKMNFPAMMGGLGAAPTSLPADITRSQFVVLKSYRPGLKKSKDVSKSLSMDKSEVEKDAQSLKQNGYLTGDNKLTSKAMELLGS